MPARRYVTALLVAALPALFLASQLDLPLYEDGLFWWVPQALWIAERGPAWVPAGELPGACLPDAWLPPQWTGGLPDYGHPPLWFHYLALWLRLLGPTAWSVRVACLPLALLLGWGAVALARRLAGLEAPPLALAALLSPTLLGQLLRPDTDLPLLVLVLAALVAVADARPWRFAALAGLAAWCKEPAVLLAVPAALAGLRDRRFLAASCAAPAALAAWATIHRARTGWALAGAERIPENAQAWLHDLGAVASIALLEGGRWAAWAASLGAAALAWRRRALRDPTPDPGRRRALLACAAFLVSQILAFSFLNFLGGRGLLQAFTHVRYLLPAAVVGTLLAAGLAQRLISRAFAPRLSPARLSLVLALSMAVAALPGARRLGARGPEANLFSLDQARAWEVAALDLARADPAPRRATWVESQLFTALTRPWAGLVERGVRDVRPFGPDTLPEDLAPGDRLVRCRYGEPLGRLGELRRAEIERVAVGEAWVLIERVLPGRTAPPPARTLESTQR